MTTNTTLLTLKQAHERLHISRAQLYRLFERGVLGRVSVPALPGRTFIFEGDVERLEKSAHYIAEDAAAMKRVDDTVKALSSYDGCYSRKEHSAPELPKEPQIQDVPEGTW